MAQPHRAERSEGRLYVANLLGLPYGPRRRSQRRAWTCRVIRARRTRLASSGNLRPPQRCAHGPNRRHTTTVNAGVKRGASTTDTRSAKRAPRPKPVGVELRRDRGNCAGRLIARENPLCCHFPLKMLILIITKRVFFGTDSGEPLRPN